MWNTSSTTTLVDADLDRVGIETHFPFGTDRCIIWEGIEIPLKEKHIISDVHNATAIYYQSIEPRTVLQEAEARQKRILDADYYSALVDLESYAHKETHLSTRQQEQLVCS